MSDETRKGVSPVVWLLVGVVLAGAPLGFFVWQLKGQLADAQASLARLETNFNQLQQERSELVKPDLPVQVSFRKALISAGLVLTVRNVSQSDLALVANFSRNGASPKQAQLVVPAQGVREVGEQEGWAFVAGDTVSISSPNYRDWRGSARAP